MSVREAVDGHFDAAVVGSGFGGAVMACRLAQAGKRVCVLERGKAYPPGSFPRSPFKMKQNLWDPSEGLHGMFDVWSFRGLDAVISSGLGGGSLIYANVLLRKDEKWFVHEDLEHGGYEYWPVNREQLDSYYDRAESMLGAQKFPLAYEPYASTPKTRAFRAAAQRAGLQWDLPNLAVTFANRGEPPVPGEPIREPLPNLHGRTRSTCRMCGECDIGCNSGSKNTLDYNYLSEAQRRGALLRTRCEVRTFAPREGGGYIVGYVEHLPEHEGHKTDTRKLPVKTLTCDKLVLSAGAIGTPYLLLRNRDAFRSISPTLGTRWGDNGDLLGFAMKARETNGARRPRTLDPSYGPVITSYVRVPDASDGGTGRGFYIEDAGYPDFINWMLLLGEEVTGLERFLRFAWRWLQRWRGNSTDADLSADISGLFGDCALSKSSLPLLGMGRDLPNGKMTLDAKGLLDLNWNLEASRGYFDRVRATMRTLCEQLGATYSDDPLWLLGRVITVHPLGGCPMGRHHREGVVDENGEVFGYPGLFIADGSVMPGPVGANPSLTIAALAERFAESALARRPS